MLKRVFVLSFLVVFAISCAAFARGLVLEDDFSDPAASIEKWQFLRVGGDEPFPLDSGDAVFEDGMLTLTHAPDGGLSWPWVSFDGALSEFEVELTVSFPKLLLVDSHMGIDLIPVTEEGETVNAARKLIMMRAGQKAFNLTNFDPMEEINLQAPYSFRPNTDYTVKVRVQDGKMTVIFDDLEFLLPYPMEARFRIGIYTYNQVVNVKYLKITEL